MFGSGARRVSRLVAVAAGLALAGGVGVPRAASAQEDEAAFGSVGECVLAGEGLGTCIDLLVPAPAAPPAFGDEEEGGVAFDPADLLPNFFADDEEE